MFAPLQFCLGYLASITAPIFTDFFYYLLRCGNMKFCDDSNKNEIYMGLGDLRKNFNFSEKDLIKSKPQSTEAPNHRLLSSAIHSAEH